MVDPQNAPLSSDEGKAPARSRRRARQPATTPEIEATQAALRHGLGPDAPLVLDDESPEEWEEFRQDFVAELAPQGRIETDLAERIARLHWKLRRVMRLESAAMAAELDPSAPGGGRGLPERTMNAIIKLEGQVSRSLDQSRTMLRRLQQNRQRLAEIRPARTPRRPASRPLLARSQPRGAQPAPEAPRPPADPSWFGLIPASSPAATAPAPEPDPSAPLSVVSQAVAAPEPEGAQGWSFGIATPAATDPGPQTAPTVPFVWSTAAGEPPATGSDRDERFIVLAAGFDPDQPPDPPQGS